MSAQRTRHHRALDGRSVCAEIARHTQDVRQVLGVEVDARSIRVNGWKPPDDVCIDVKDLAVGRALERGKDPRS